MSFSPTRRTLLVSAATAAALLPFLGVPALAKPRDRFAALEASCGGRIGVAGVNTGNGATVLHRANQRFPFCSTFKLILATAILSRSVGEPGLLDQKVTWGKRDLVTYSPMTSQHVETGMTVAELCAAALELSDNTAANQLIRLIGGPAAVTAFARSIGDREFRLDRWETELNSAIPGDPRDTTTPMAMMTDLRRAALGDLLPAAQRDRLVEWLRGSQTGANRIRSAAPEGAIVGDKTGSGDKGTGNDVAVIWPRGKAPIVLAVYVTGRKTRTADEIVAAAARIAFDALG